jgi:hypothetical protein
MVVPTVAAGQVVLTGPPEPAATSSVHVGPLKLNPAVTIRDFGVESNIFNESVNPKSDFTTTLSPEVDAWMRLGHGRLQAKTRVDFVYFADYAEERSANTYTRLTYDLPLGRFDPYVSNEFLKTNERMNLEIDARARRSENATSAGTTIRISKKTSAAFEVRRTIVRFDSGSEFLGTDLATVLNRTDDGLRTAFRYALTPYTTVVGAYDTQRTTFLLAPERDTNSSRVGAGVEFGVRALINGSMYVGQQTFSLTDPGIPAFQGPIASINMAHVFAGSTRVSFSLDRNIVYSFEPTEPYYVATGWGVTVTERIANGSDAHATLSNHQLAYRGLPTATLPVDEVLFFNAGFGSRVSRHTRFGVDLVYRQRQSVVVGREFQGTTLSSSATYKF